MTKRVYNFPLPYEVPAYKVHFGLPQLQEMEFYPKIPVDIRAKFEYCASAWEPVSITKEMCDSIDDDCWQMIAQRLDLDWNLE